MRINCWIRGIPPAERGSHNHGHPASQKRIAIHQIWVHVVRCNHTRGDYVIEETSPLIPSYHEYGIEPSRAARQGLKNLTKKCFARAQVGMGMIVIALA